jgi:hypothetical protein
METLPPTDFNVAEYILYIDTLLPTDFNVADYILYNSDLNGWNETDAKTHYIRWGQTEGRIYKLPLDFDASAYLKHNPDLKLTTETEAKIHYGYSGRKDIPARIYKNITPPVVETPKMTGGSNTYLIVGIVVLGAFLLTRK